MEHDNPPAVTGATPSGAALSRGSNDSARSTLDAIGDAVLSADFAGRVIYLNPVAEQMTGWLSADAMGQPLDTILPFVDGDTHMPVVNPMLLAMTLDRAVGLTANCLLIRRDGAELAIEDSAAPIHDCDGQVTGAVIVFRDVGAARTKALRMAHFAQHDYLTDLPNRILFGDRLGAALALGHRHGRRGAVLFLDIDRFKEINDTLGHTIGDELLQSVARRLVASVRSSDTVCRQGGDEFVVLLPEIERARDAAISAETILVALAAPHCLRDTTIEITASIGICIYPDDGSDAKTLLRCADAAMYEAKNQGGASYRYFAPNMNDPACAHAEPVRAWTRRP